jgi:hypothetical protein
LLDPLPARDEAALLRLFEGHPACAQRLALLGVDRYGVDWMRDGVRVRCGFDAPKTDDVSLRAALLDCLGRYAD